MKRLSALIGLIIICCSAFSPMPYATWASLGANEVFTFNELQDAVTNGIFPSTGVSIPATDSCVSKFQVGTYIHNNVDGTAYAALGNAELLTKGVMTVSTCRELIVTVGSGDRLAADDGYVYFDYTDCCGVFYTQGYNTNKTSFATGLAFDSRFTFSPNPYILVGGVHTACSGGSTFTTGNYISGCIAN